MTAAAVVSVLIGAGAAAIWNVYLGASTPPAKVVADEAPAVPLPDQPSIAVLPCVNMSDDPAQEYFVDGITEDIITDLSNIENLVVIARNSVFTYKGKAVKVQKVSRELGVRYVLEGSVRKSGSRVRITTQLVDATSGQHLWAERYDRDLEDVFALQDEITHKIVAILAGYAVKSTSLESAKKIYQGLGTVIEVQHEKSRVVVDHGEIEGFMAAMEMSYMVSPATLLQGVKPGDKVRFTIDADERMIVDLVVHEK